MRTVVVVGMLDSVHFARWLSQFKNEEISFMIFPSSPQRKLHPQLGELLGYRRGASFKLAPLSRYYSLPLWLIDRLFDDYFRGVILRTVIKKIQPDFLHALELQNAGYLVLRALRGQRQNYGKLIVTNYGSDIFWFRQFNKHLQKLRELLAIADCYAAECERDLQLALELGFSGELMPVRPNAGGFPSRLLERPLRSFSSRTSIAVKGYLGWVGRADIAIKALDLISKEISRYQVVFYSCNFSTVRLAKSLARRTSLNVKIFRKKALTHAQMLSLFEESAVYVGLSESDGISTSMLEAMAMGAIPVQTSTACCDEWFNQTGVNVKDMRIEEVANAILKALDLANDPSNQIANRETIRSKASEEYVRDAALKFYL